MPRRAALRCRQRGGCRCPVSSHMGHGLRTRYSAASNKAVMSWWCHLQPQVRSCTIRRPRRRALDTLDAHRCRHRSHLLTRIRTRATGCPSKWIALRMVLSPWSVLVLTCGQLRSRRSSPRHSAQRKRGRRKVMSHQMTAFSSNGLRVHAERWSLLRQWQ